MSNKKRGGGASKRKGKIGESNAKKWITSLGWLVADSETQGLAGDDIFARDPNGKWWSIEIKNTSCWYPKYLSQAKKQAKERFIHIQEELKGPRGEILYAMGIHKFRACDYLILWHPSNNFMHNHQWNAVHKEKGSGNYNVCESPFMGELKL